MKVSALLVATCALVSPCRADDTVEADRQAFFGCLHSKDGPPEKEALQRLEYCMEALKADRYRRALEAEMLTRRPPEQINCADAMRFAWPKGMAMSPYIRGRIAKYVPAYCLETD